MNSNLPDKKRLVSFKALVPKNTPISSPVSVFLQLQNPIIDYIRVLATNDETPFTIGMKVLINGMQILPAPESNATADAYDSPDWIAPYSYIETRLDNLGIQISGAPFLVELQFYNVSTSNDYYFWGFILTSPKIPLEKMPIQDDRLLKKEPLNPEQKNVS